MISLVLVLVLVLVRVLSVFVWLVVSLFMVFCFCVVLLHVADFGALVLDLVIHIQAKYEMQLAKLSFDKNTEYHLLVSLTAEVYF